MGSSSPNDTGIGVEQSQGPFMFSLLKMWQSFWKFHLSKILSLNHSPAIYNTLFKSLKLRLTVFIIEEGVAYHVISFTG